jgi:biotin operon repressor
MRSKELDRRFDSGEDISKYLDLSKIRRPGQEQKRVNVDFPVWMIRSLDKVAKRLGVPRQSVIKVWVAERLEKS